jgi:signal transduction histidine kinase
MIKNLLKRKISAFLLILVIYHQGFCIEYQFLQFRVEDGLKTDIIKTLGQDSLGFIWIGSDDGLMQYNGHQFLHYPHATQSPFIKELLSLRDGRLLVLNDLGLVEIINQIDTVIFNSILPGTRVPTDTTIWYPKSIFEDSKGNFWIGEPQSIVKYDGKTIDRIEFGEEDNSSSFVRSFNFAELPGSRILISSITGNFYIYNNITGTFNFLDYLSCEGEINHVLYWNESVYLASSVGVYRIYNLDGERFEFEKIIDHVNASNLSALNDVELLISSFTDESLIYNLNDKSYRILPYDLTVVNQVFRSKEGNLWLSTEKGVVLLQSHIFSKIKTESDNIYVESIALTPAKDKVYFSSKEHIRVFEPGRPQSEVFDIRRQGYFLSLQFSDKCLWASNATEILKYNQDGQELSSWDFAEYGRFIFDIVIDKEKNVWFTQEASEGLKMIAPSGDIKFYDESYGLNRELTIVRLGEEGIYTGSNTSSAYLFYKNYEDTLFRNISVPVDFEYRGNFRIEDIAEAADVIWLASSVGLLKQSDGVLQKIELEDRYNELLVKSVKVQHGTPYIWFNNAYGLIQYNTETGDYNIYDESHGLPSNTINTRAISIKTDGIWLGTASGLAYSEFDFSTLNKTPLPYVINWNADGKKYLPGKLNQTALPSNSYLEIVVSSPSYPSNKLRYQYKIDENEKWEDLTEGNLLTFSKLSSGRYNISFRSKKGGNYGWSDANNYEFEVEKAYYETWYFMLFVLMIIILLVIITRYISVRILVKRQQELEKLVAERTMELERVNTNLLERNQELDQFVYSTSHDLSAPLKSIRGLINIANYEKDVSALKELLHRMNDSVIKLETFIRDVISYSRNARLRVKKTEIKLKDLVSEILEHLSNLDNFYKIKFDLQIEEDTTIKTDETRIKIVLNNLLSNAIKFQRFDEETLPFVNISYWFENNRHHIMVKDNGVGINEEYTEKIFNMFYRASVRSDGSGLGLYILKETLKNINGNVDVKSKEGVGSEFIISFPQD